MDKQLIVCHITRWLTALKIKNEHYISCKRELNGQKHKELQHLIFEYILSKRAPVVMEFTLHSCMTF